MCIFYATTKVGMPSHPKTSKIVMLNNFPSVLQSLTLDEIRLNAKQIQLLPKSLTKLDVCIREVCDLSEFVNLISVTLGATYFENTLLPQHIEALRLKHGVFRLNEKPIISLSTQRLPMLQTLIIAIFDNYIIRFDGPFPHLKYVSTGCTIVNLPESIVMYHNDSFAYHKKFESFGIFASKPDAFLSRREFLQARHIVVYKLNEPCAAAIAQTAVENLTIFNCKYEFVPNFDLYPNLRHLCSNVWRIDTPFPSNLVTLRLFTEHEEEFFGIRYDSSLFPSTLTCLSIAGTLMSDILLRCPLLVTLICCMDDADAEQIYNDEFVNVVDHTTKTLLNCTLHVEITESNNHKVVDFVRSKGFLLDDDSEDDDNNVDENKDDNDKRHKICLYDPYKDGMERLYNSKWARRKMFRDRKGERRVSIVYTWANSMIEYGLNSIMRSSYDIFDNSYNTVLRDSVLKPWHWNEFRLNSVFMP
jgi:hypothetical protein